MDLQVKIAPYPNGTFSCVIDNGAGYISFVRAGDGKITRVARTTWFTEVEYQQALRLAAEQISHHERQAQAAVGAERLKERAAAGEDVFILAGAEDHAKETAPGWMDEEPPGGWGSI